MVRHYDRKFILGIEKSIDSELNNKFKDIVEELRIKRKEKANSRGGGIKVSAVFGNVNGLSSLRKTHDFERFRNHSFTYSSETMVSEDKFEINNELITKSKIIEVTQASRNSRRGRPAKGQMFYHAKRFNGSCCYKDEDSIVIKMEDVFIVGVYLQFGLELDDKISIICGILDKIYEICHNPKIVLGGDFNIKSSENDGADIEALEEVLEEYNVMLQSDKKEPTCFNNNNRGCSTVDYVFCINNFPQISKKDYYRLHAGSDHSAIRISFKLPRYVVSKKRKEIVMELGSSKTRFEDSK